jgi:hypothetical protein
MQEVSMLGSTVIITEKEASNPIHGDAVNMLNAVQKRKESIVFSAAAPQGNPVGDDEKLKLEAEILEIDGAPGGPRGSPFKKRRDAAYAERDKAKEILACLTNDYEEAVKKAAAEYESGVQKATFRVNKANLFVDEVAATFRRRKLIQEQLDDLNKK